MKAADERCPKDGCTGSAERDIPLETERVLSLTPAGMERPAYNRPKLEVGIRKGHSVSGEALCPACGASRPPEARFCGSCAHDLSKPAPERQPIGKAPEFIKTRDKHNQGTGNATDFVQRIVVILVLLAIAGAVYLFIHDHYQEAAGRSTIFGSTNSLVLSSQAEFIVRNLLVPLDAVSGVSPQHIRKLRQDVEPLAKDPDTAALAKLVAEFARQAQHLLERREALQGNAVASGPVSLDPGGASDTAARSFIRDVTSKQWDNEVEAGRGGLTRSLIEIRREEERLGRTALSSAALTFKKVKRTILVWLGMERVQPQATQPGKVERTGMKCPQCGGAAYTRCGSCGGKGRISQEVRQPCAQCSGSGMYASKTSKTKTRCPFCSGSGFKSTSEPRNCPTCGGMGRVACSTCPP